jgi:hypothetical protein
MAKMPSGTSVALQGKKRQEREVAPLAPPCALVLAFPSMKVLDALAELFENKVGLSGARSAASSAGRSESHLAAKVASFTGGHA